MDSEGQPKCGGEGCSGVVSQTNSSLKKAQDTEQEITSAMEEVEKLSKMVSPLRTGWVPVAPALLRITSPVRVQVSEAKVKADEARQSAQEVLMKTNRTKQRVDESNEELRTLIKQIRDFLTRRSQVFLSFS